MSSVVLESAIGISAFPTCLKGRVASISSSSTLSFSCWICLYLAFFLSRHVLQRLGISRPLLLFFETPSILAQAPLISLKQAVTTDHLVFLSHFELILTV